MNVTLEAERYALIAVARQSWLSQQQENSARTGDPLAAVPSNQQIINESPPLSQQLQSISAREIVQSSDASQSAVGADDALAKNNVTAVAGNNDNKKQTNDVNVGNENHSAEVHDAFGRFNIVA